MFLESKSKVIWMTIDIKISKIAGYNKIHFRDVVSIWSPRVNLGGNKGTYQSKKIF